MGNAELYGKGILVPLATRCLLFIAVTLGFTAIALGQWHQPPQTLPGTRPLTREDPLDVAMMDGAHRFIERKIDNSPEARARHWNPDLSSPAAYRSSVAVNRERLRTIIGAVNRGAEPNYNIALPALSATADMQRIADEQCPAVLAENDIYRITRVRWPVLKGVHGEGLLLEPRMPALGHVVAVPDAGQLPEELAGLAGSLRPEQQIARRLAENGIRVIVPVLISRDKLLHGDKQQTHREWIYRQAFHMGRHIIGYEVEKLQAALDWLLATSEGSAPLGIAGYGEGGLLAFYTAAVDTRIDAALVSGYFGPRERVWSEPIYRNIWSLLRQFGDAEIASLIAPRSLVIEYSQLPDVQGQKGELQTPAFQDVLKEANRVDALTRPGFQQRSVVRGKENKLIGPWSVEAMNAFAKQLGCGPLRDSPAPRPIADRLPDAKQRQLRQLWELDDYTQRLVRDSEKVREDFYLYQLLPEFKRPRWSTEAVHETTEPAEFIEKSRQYRDYLWEEVLGKLEDPLLEPRPRTRLIANRDDWVAYDVVLDVFPDLFAWGILMLPKNLDVDDRRPVVVLQHGRNGLPSKVMEGGYNYAAEKLLKRGFIVFAPHNPYRGEDRYRWLDRKANSVKASLFSFIIAQHDQITRWLAKLPMVDGQRIGFYGNSYGGETAVRVPPILDRYALSICASDFNDWTRKVADTHDWHSFMDTIEWEMPYFNMGSTFSYAELAYLMIPRPFMVERGHHDLVAPDHWVASEFAKVRWLYDQFGLDDRRDIEFFQGGHTMKGNRTIEFLERHLGPARTRMK